MTPDSSTDSATRDGLLQKLAEAAKSTAGRRDGVVCGILTVACCNKMEAERDALIDQLAREADTLLAASRAEVERLQADAERYQWLEQRFLGADFRWGADEESSNEGCQTLIFTWPGHPVWGDLSMTLDAARALSTKKD